jgi:hypothetical protein
LTFGKRMLYGTPCTDKDTDKVFVIGLEYQTIYCITQPGLQNNWKIIYGNTTLTDPEFNHPVRVKWGRGADTMEYWDQLSISSLELFGLPGDRFITDISAEEMTWFFKNEQDALIFKLKFSEVTC